MMHAVFRYYMQASALFDLLAERQEEVKGLLRGVPGFVAYYAVRMGETGVTVTVCQDEAGTEESTRRAAQWVQENASGLNVSPPQVSEGEVIISA
jgi:hypothetical protein